MARRRKLLASRLVTLNPAAILEFLNSDFALVSTNKDF